MDLSVTDSAGCWSCRRRDTLLCRLLRWSLLWLRWRWRWGTLKKHECEGVDSFMFSFWFRWFLFLALGVGIQTIDLLQGCCRDCVEGCGLLSCCELMGCLACSCGCSEVLGLCWVRDKEKILRIYIIFINLCMSTVCFLDNLVIIVRNQKHPQSSCQRISAICM